MMKTAKILYVCATLIFTNGCATNSERSVLSVIEGNVSDRTTLNRVNSDLSAVCVDLFVNSKTTDRKPGYQSYKGMRRHFAAGFDTSGSNISCAWFGGGWARFSADETRAQAIERCNELMPQKNGCQIYADGNEIIFQNIGNLKAHQISDPGAVEQITDLDQNNLTNPNNLPPCPDPDYSKKTDLERVGKWHNCWGVYKVELDNLIKGDIYKGEFVNGNLHGQVLTQLFSRKEKYIGSRFQVRSATRFKDS